MKKTQIVTHLMPGEVEDYGDMLDKLTDCSKYLDEHDWVSISATLNLSPTLVDWDNSEYDTDFFVKYFENLKEKVSWANEVIFDVELGNTILGVMDHKREAVKGDYDQFIFLDGDMIFHPMTLKCMLDISNQVTGNYYITPQIVRLWDTTWDILVHKDFMHIEPQKNGYYRQHHPDITMSQVPTEVGVKMSPYIKFGCGWFTLCSKSVLDLIRFPESWRGYGPDDTFLMAGSELAKKLGYEVNQYILDGIYVSENKIYRKTNFKDKLVMKDQMLDFKEENWKTFNLELQKVKDRLL